MPRVKISKSKGLEQVQGNGVQVDVAATIEGVSNYRRHAKNITAATTLTAADSGIIAFISASNSVTCSIDLPTAAAAGAGWYADFIVADDNNYPVYIDTQADSTLLFTYMEDGGADGHGITVATERTLVFTADCGAGPRIEMVSDGTNYFAHGFCVTAAHISGSGDELPTGL